MDTFGTTGFTIILILSGVVFIVALAAFIYWTWVITEGTYLGSWAVILGYDIMADKYDGIKEFTLDDESILVLEPILGEIGDLAEPRLLDIATGTGRVPYFMAQDPRFAHFTGRVTALEPSQKMLTLAQQKMADIDFHVNWVRQTAVPLPFPDNSFDMITCLEALEFFPDQTAALREMHRVLKPNGTLMITRRTGWEAKMFFGRHLTREEFELRILSVGFSDAMSFLWETIYDLTIAHKM